MSYLTLQKPSKLDTKKAVISLWFRVPKELLDQAMKEFTAWNNSPKETRPLLTGIVPLMTFGPPTKQKGYSTEQVKVGTFPQSANWHWSDGTGFPTCVGSGWVMDSSSYTPSQPFTVSQAVINSQRLNLDPSYIGVDCTGPYPALSVHIAMPSGNTSKITGTWSEQVGYSNTADGIPNYGGGGICPGAPNTFSGPFGLQMNTVTNPPAGFSSIWTVTHTYDSSGKNNLMLIRPEFFRLLPSARVGDNAGHSFSNDLADQNYGGQKVTPDHWHHLLLSFDLSNSCVTRGERVVEVRHLDPHTGLTVQDSISGESALPANAGRRTSSACKMWVAFDDVNLTSAKLSCYWPAGYRDPNAILTVTGYYVACDTTFSVNERVYDINGTDTTTISDWDQPSYSLTPAAIPFSAGPLGLPAIASYVDAIKRVEMAELQFFADTTLNTADVKQRRAFISKDGKPVSPIKQKSKTDPQSGSIELLHKKPEILLHGTGNWKTGHNTGSLGVDKKGKKIQSGQFEPTAKIEAYKPDPSLRGNQGDQKKALA